MKAIVITIMVRVIAKFGSHFPPKIWGLSHSAQRVILKLVGPVARRGTVPDLLTAPDSRGSVHVVNRRPGRVNGAA